MATLTEMSDDVGKFGNLLALCVACRLAEFVAFLHGSNINNQNIVRMFRSDIVNVIKRSEMNAS